MQCPSCGFENIPGTERCSVCSTALPGKAGGECLIPPRAKDRSAWERMTWSITTSSSFTGMLRRFQGFRGRLSSIRLRNPGVAAPWLGFRQMGDILLSAIPGMGHIRVLGDARTGLRMFLGSMAAILIAVATYKTPIADILVFSVIAASMYSVYAVVDELRPKRPGERAQYMGRIAIGCFVLATYVMAYWGLRTAINPWMMIVRVINQPPTNIVMRGDSLLLRRHQTIRRGDIAVGIAYWQRHGMPALGPVIGVPGDKIAIGQDVYVNGIPAGIPLSFTQPYELTLRADEYWIMPIIRMANRLAAPDLMLAGIVRGTDIWGKGIAIMGPPWHRRLLTPNERQTTNGTP